MRSFGFTLIELVVALAVLMIGLAVVAVAPGWIAGTRDRVSAGEGHAAIVAVQERRPVAVTVLDSLGIGRHIVYLPDGRAVGHNVDPLTGRAK